MHPSELEDVQASLAPAKGSRSLVLMPLEHPDEGDVAGEAAGDCDLLDAHLGIDDQFFCQVNTLLVDALNNADVIASLESG